MTNWQWKILIALVRTVLRMRNVDLTLMYMTGVEEEDDNVLIEAAIRNG